MMKDDDFPEYISKRQFSVWKELKRIVIQFFIMGSLILFFSSVIFLICWKYFAPSLENINFLKTYTPPMVSRFYADNGSLFTEHSLENRTFIPLKCVPQKIIHAFLAAEDKGFYHHYGFDPSGIFRAIVKNWFYKGRLSGASTITQQLAKNLVLKDSSITLNRKLRELFTAFQMERLLTKDRILELYLNEIYLGRRAYGIGTASLSYFNKGIDELSLEEIAFLAALPQAPSLLDPLKHPDRCLKRRNWVLERMHILGYITSEEYEEARQKPFSSFPGRYVRKIHEADYFDEYVKQNVVNISGLDSLYKGGLNIQTTLRPSLQKCAKESLRRACEEHDRRQGFRGALFHSDAKKSLSEWKDYLKKLPRPQDKPNSWTLARVTGVQSHEFKIYTQEGESGYITLKTSLWARTLGPDHVSLHIPKKCQEIVSVGDVVWVEKIINTFVLAKKINPEEEKKVKKNPQEYTLKQWPHVNAALVVINPQNGHVMAMVGGYSFHKSQFNRAVQAHRSFGSLAKPFVYFLALNRGWNPDDMIMDEPFSWDWDAHQSAYKPHNIDKKFKGEMTFRTSLTHSRNVTTMTLLRDTIKIKPLHTLFKSLDLNISESSFYCVPSLGLGAFETTVLRAASAYCSLANGGYKIQPVVIRRIHNPGGDLIWKTPVLYRTSLKTEENIPPVMCDLRPCILRGTSVYQINHILSEGVKRGGTSHRLAGLTSDLAAKTGTSSEERDGWCVAYTPQIVVVAYMGYDDFRPLKEPASKSTLPMIQNFLKLVFSESKNKRLYGGNFSAHKDILWRPTQAHSIVPWGSFHPDFEPVQEREEDLEE